MPVILQPVVVARKRHFEVYIAGQSDVQVTILVQVRHGDSVRMDHLRRNHRVHVDLVRDIVSEHAAALIEQDRNAVRGRNSHDQVRLPVSVEIAGRNVRGIVLVEVVLLRRRAGSIQPEQHQGTGVELPLAVVQQQRDEVRPDVRRHVHRHGDVHVPVQVEVLHHGAADGPPGRESPAPAVRAVLVEVPVGRPSALRDVVGLVGVGGNAGLLIHAEHHGLDKPVGILNAQRLQDYGIVERDGIGRRLYVVDDRVLVQNPDGVTPVACQVLRACKEEGTDILLPGGRHGEHPRAAADVGQHSTEVIVQKLVLVRVEVAAIENVAVELHGRDAEPVLLGGVGVIGVVDVHRRERDGLIGHNRVGVLLDRIHYGLLVDVPEGEVVRPRAPRAVIVAGAGEVIADRPSDFARPGPPIRTVRVAPEESVLGIPDPVVVGVVVELHHVDDAVGVADARRGQREELPFADRLGLAGQGRNGGPIVQLPDRGSGINGDLGQDAHYDGVIGVAESAVRHHIGPDGLVRLPGAVGAYVLEQQVPGHARRAGKRVPLAVGPDVDLDLARVVLVIAIGLQPYLFAHVPKAVGIDVVIEAQLPRSAGRAVAVVHGNGEVVVVIGLPVTDEVQLPVTREADLRAGSEQNVAGAGRIQHQVIGIVLSALAAVDAHEVRARRHAVEGYLLVAGRTRRGAGERQRRIVQLQVQIAVCLEELDADELARSAVCGQLESEPVLIAGLDGQTRPSLPAPHGAQVGCRRARVIRLVDVPGAGLHPRVYALIIKRAEAARLLGPYELPDIPGRIAIEVIEVKVALHASLPVDGVPVELVVDLRVDAEVVLAVGVHVRPQVLAGGVVEAVIIGVPEVQVPLDAGGWRVEGAVVAAVEPDLNDLSAVRVGDLPGRQRQDVALVHGVGLVLKRLDYGR